MSHRAFDADQIHRGRFSYSATDDLADNETFVILKHGSGSFRFTVLLWQFLVGSHTCPGLAISIHDALKPGLPETRQNSGHHQR